MDRSEKEKLFEEHIENLTKRNKEMFHKLLDETNVSVKFLYRCLCLKSAIWWFSCSVFTLVVIVYFIVFVDKHRCHMEGYKEIYKRGSKI